MKAVKNIRLKQYDYSTNGYYFVTICTNNRKPYLKDKEDLICQTVEDINQIEGVSIDYYVILLNHVHLIVILEDSIYKLGEIIRQFKAKTSRQTGFKLWQPNYYEHVIRSEAALLKIREYIQNNPLVEKIKFEQFYS